jgi:hypothetical protein
MSKVDTRPIVLKTIPRGNHLVLQDSVVKLQALFRGYSTRKKLKQSLVAPVETENSIDLSPELVIDIKSESINTQKSVLDLNIEKNKKLEKAGINVQTNLELNPKPESKCESIEARECDNVKKLALSNGTVYSGTLFITQRRND